MKGLLLAFFIYIYSSGIFCVYAIYRQLIKPKQSKLLLRVKDFIWLWGLGGILFLAYFLMGGVGEVTIWVPKRLQEAHAVMGMFLALIGAVIIFSSLDKDFNWKSLNALSKTRVGVVGVVIGLAVGRAIGELRSESIGFFGYLLLALFFIWNIKKFIDFWRSFVTSKTVGQ